MPRSVLLVDDDPAVLRLLTRLFEREGWTTHAAPTGAAGLALWEQERPDLTLLDLDLPVVSGLDVLEVLVGRGAAVIMLTGHADVATAVDAMRRGAENFLTKPVDVTHVAAAAARAVEKVELRRTNESLARSLAERAEEHPLGTSPRMRELDRQVEMLAGADHVSVLLLGDSGTGKSWVARALHARGPRARRPFVEINCAGLSATFLDSELFGHEKGAFTDAKESKRGLFEVADGGTLFLDEIGDLAPELQPKLLRVLETRSFRRLGGTRELEVDVRLVAATNRDLEADVRTGRFREDLFYRLNVFPLVLPPLRERAREDVLQLVQQVLRDLRRRDPEAPAAIAPQALEALVGYAWPGNVRQLRNVLERALVLAGHGARIEPEHLPAELRASDAPRSRRDDLPFPTLAEMERDHIARALALTGGNRTAAAERLGLGRTTLYAKIRDYGLEEVGRE